jgi:hypothetical protein
MKNFILTGIIILVTASGCREVFGKRIRGNGHIQAESRSLTAFKNIDVSGSINIYVKHDSVFSVKVESDENLLQYVEVYNEAGTLQIHERDGVNLKPTHEIKVFVAGPDFNRFEASGACNIYSENRVNGSKAIEIDLSGASDVKMDIKSPRVNAELSGAGTINIKGETKDFSVKGSGSTDIKCFDLMAENVDVRISGAGDAEVFASVKLDVHVSGAGDVKYKGSANVSQKVSGAGSVRKVD